MMFALLFLFGLVFGSFGYVLALRYDGNHFLLNPKVIGGRSYCPHCHKTLQWFELIPFLSFAIQGGKCRNCKARIGFIYPIVEFLSGFLFIFVAARVQDFYGIVTGFDFWVLAVLWIAFFFALLLLSIIDIRLGIIPDEIVVFLGVIAISIVSFTTLRFDALFSSFFGQYSVLFGLANNPWANHLLGAIVGMIFFGGLVMLTRGKGMGMGDVKLAIPLGLLFGWPGILFLSATAFVIGAIFGLCSMAFAKKTMKSAVSFGPFLAIGASFVFFYGLGFIDWYFRFMGL